MINLEPPIKWSGSKKSQAKEILTYFPREINTYYEPFCGGASVLRALLLSDIKVNNYVCSDLNADLINLWNCIKNNPTEIINHYTILWTELNRDSDINRKKEYFNLIRDRYNKEHSPLDFMFLMRTCTNGMPRYNQKGEFNTSFHITRKGIEPGRLRKICENTSKLLNEKNVEFRCSSYKEIYPNKNDFMYLDPPYVSSKAMYFGNFDVNNLWNYLENINCNYILSFDGKCEEKNNTYNVPKYIYDKHIYLKSGKSSFRKVVSQKDTMVYESLYIKTGL